MRFVLLAVLVGAAVFVVALWAVGPLWTAIVYGGSLAVLVAGVWRSARADRGEMGS